MPFIDTVNATLAIGTQLYDRDFKTRVTPNVTQRNTLIVAGCYAIAIGILWCVIFETQLLFRN